MAAGALLGTRTATPGLLVLGAPPVGKPAAWPPAGLTLEEKIDLLMGHIGPPRPDLAGGDRTITDQLLILLGVDGV